MANSSRRLLLFAAASIGGLGLLVVLLLLFAQPPRLIAPSPSAATPTPWIVATVDDEPIHFAEWARAVALDQVMSTLVGQVPPSPEETLDQLIKQRLVLRAAVAAGIPGADRAQADAWLVSFLTSQGLDEAALDQALARAGLTSAELLEEIVPRLLRVQRALQELSPNGNGEAWATDLRRQAKVEVLENLSTLLVSDQITPPPQETPQPMPPAVSLPTGPRVGELAPDFSLPATDGATVRLADLRGHVVLLNFWATWCASCRVELPLLQTAYQLDKDGLVVLGIDVRESPDTVIIFATDLDLELPLLLDQEGRVSDLYQVRGLPSSLFVDRDGLIAARHVGPLDQAALDSYLASLLTTPSNPLPNP